jgi:4,5-DOPA dioxygenase extradiol
MQRRQLLKALGAAPLLGLACGRAEQNPAAPMAVAELSGNPERGSLPQRTAGERLPVLFVAHGAPMLMDDAGWVQELAAWSGALARPRAVLMVSAHWDASPAALGATKTVPLVYDFSGFSERYYQVKYPAPGAPELAARVRELLRARSMRVRDVPTRGLDHGAYVPLLCMYPAADIPVLQLSLPGLEPRTLFDFGQALAPLRREGVLVVGSGFLTHNMRYGFSRETPAWASEFDAWAAETLAQRDVDALIDFETRGPGARMALPTTEHFAPVIVAAGAASDQAEPVTFPITGFWRTSGGFTRRSVQFG